ncbi:MAG: hypothetical protein ABSG94_02820 [Brevinematales bacterium]|jgi:hypothetical protein
MKLYCLLILFISALLACSCQLLGNPDFNNKNGMGVPGASLNNANEANGPGSPSLTGKFTSYQSGFKVNVSIDGGTYTQASINYPYWVLQNQNLACGPHMISARLVDSGGNIKDSQNFIYNVPAYVDINFGRDAYAGNTPSNPFKSVQAGIDGVTNFIYKTGYPGNVFVSAGSYTPANGGIFSSGNAGIYLNSLTPPYSYINISGGWMNNFLSRSGVSILDMTGTQSPVVDLSGSSHIIKLGSNSSFNFITNSLITGNGQGVWIVNSMENNVSAVIFNNTGLGSGAGVNISGTSFSNSINGIISNNISTSGDGGGIYMAGTSYNTINASVIGNTALDGGGIYIDLEQNDTINGNVINNINGGIYTSANINLIINGAVSGNTVYQIGSL